MNRQEKRAAPSLIVLLLTIMVATGWAAHNGQFAGAAAISALGFFEGWRACERLQEAKRIEDAIRRELESK